MNNTLIVTFWGCLPPAVLVGFLIWGMFQIPKHVARAFRGSGRK